MTESELKLFSEFIKRDKEEILIGNSGIAETEDIGLEVQGPPQNPLRISVSGPRAKQPKYRFKWDGDSHGPGINDHKRSINNDFELAIRKPSLSREELNDISNRMAYSQANIHRGMGMDADYYLTNDSPELKDTETGQMLEKLSERQYPDKKKLAEEYKNSIRTIREANSNSKERALEDIVKRSDNKHRSPLKIKEVPVITGPEEQEITPELEKFKKDRENGIPHKLPEQPVYVDSESPKKKDSLKDKASDVYEGLSDKYENATGRDSLGKDAAIALGTTAALGAGAYGIHRYLKNKKKNKEEAEGKYKTSDKKKKK